MTFSVFRLYCQYGGTVHYDNLGGIWNTITILWSRHHTGTSWTQWGKPRRACGKITDDPAEIRIRHLRIKVYSFPATPVSPVLPNIVIVGVSKLKISHCVLHLILTCPVFCWRYVSVYRLTYASTSAPTFTVPSHISNVLLRMALAVLYSKANRRVGLLKTI
jgi:hypothetical protein